MCHPRSGSRPRDKSLACVVCWLIGSAVLGFTSPGVGATVRVRGMSRLEAHASPLHDGVEVRGSLVDDADQPVSNASIQVTLDLGGVPPPTVPARGCSSLPGPVTQAGRTMARTNGLGRFCLAFPHGAMARGVRLRFAGDEHHDPTEINRIPIDTLKQTVDFDFYPKPRYLSRERSQHEIWVRARSPLVGSDDPLQLQLLLSRRDEEREALGSTVVRPGERARFIVPSARLGRPGPSLLTLRFAGTDQLQAMSHSTVVETTARVALAMDPPVSSKDGVTIPVTATSSAGPVPSGSVEALVRGQVAGSGRVANGQAEVVLRVRSSRRQDVPVTLRYLPDAPWWLPGDPLVTSITISAPNPWRAWPWFLLASVVAIWGMRNWARPRRRGATLSMDRAEAPTGRADLHVIERGPDRSGWRGQVLDAHEGTPVVGAVVSIVVPSFQPVAATTHTATDSEGKFSLEHVDAGEGARLVVEGKWHTPLSRPVPPPGAVSISVVTRRRALLERLVTWAQRLGRPWAEGQEPTPGQIARVAASRRADGIREWAGAVEVAAFGPSPVDDAGEHRIQALEPQQVRREHG